MVDEDSLKVAQSMLEDVAKAVSAFEYVALSFQMVMSHGDDEPIVSRDDQERLKIRVEGLLRTCEAIERKLGADSPALSWLYFLRGRLYANYLPYQFPIPRYKSHKGQAIECYRRAIELAPSDGERGLAHYYLGRLHQVWDERSEAITNLQRAVELLGVDDEAGMDAAKTIEQIHAEKKGPCFIATAVYGSPLAAEVEILRDFRARVLDRFVVGRLFVRLYYRLSPRLARRIGRDAILRAITRTMLVAPLVRLARSVLSRV